MSTFNVLIPVDGSENSEKAFDWYIKFCHKPDYQVITFHSHETPQLSVFSWKPKGHNLLILKLLDRGVRSSLLPWIINFLTNRRHRVKLGGKTSDWLPMNAGVPQGTKLGPILFLAMINDLDVKPHATDIWKFVDDISTSENITKGSNSKFQFCIDTINSLASCNLMKLNPKSGKNYAFAF
ncbi:RNA-directed DNA polymerase from mobile element jockey [Paramuricea clavata]|uniref:RNA-directed DNA polymerase from mobile element jockey n=1 Tax=Paramuricea clavata TaxID=317549 RepID=A0A7D9HFN6_PARCT|nr:RNA-directed DNA polymerase from mobile element jockey [Paramuricea clavata]